ANICTIRCAGSLSWGPWGSCLSELLADPPPRADLKLPATSLKELRQLMGQPYRDVTKNRIGNHAGESARQLAAWFPSLRQPAFDWNVQGLAKCLDDRARKELDGSSWDQATQLYLALPPHRPP